MKDSMAARLPAAACANRGSRTGTGGPPGDGDGREWLVEHALGWTLVVLVAMLVTRLGFL